MKLRVKDIAKELNLSPASISLILNNKPGVSDETRERVLKAINEMGYNVDNIIKKRLQNVNKNIYFVIYKKHGLVVSDTPFFSELIEGIDRQAKNENYNLNISYLDEKLDSVDSILNNIQKQDINGILLLATEMKKEDLEQFKNYNIPLVILDSYFTGEDLDSIIINNIDGAYKATTYLAELGHKKIGYLHSSVWINNFGQRKEGYLKGLTDKNLDYNKDYIFSLESTVDGAYKDMAKILKSNPELPTAIFADNDIIALGAIKAFKEFGIRVPEDISIVGFDDMPFCEYSEPALTTIRVYKQKMGMIAVERLIDRITESPIETVRVEVSTKLIERESTRRI